MSIFLQSDFERFLKLRSFNGNLMFSKLPDIARCRSMAASQINKS
jgi:hypothetical protein